MVCLSHVSNAASFSHSTRCKQVYNGTAIVETQEDNYKAQWCYFITPPPQNSRQNSLDLQTKTMHPEELTRRSSLVGVLLYIAPTASHGGTHFDWLIQVRNRHTIGTRFKHYNHQCDLLLSIFYLVLCMKQVYQLQLVGSMHCSTRIASN